MYYEKDREIDLRRYRFIDFIKRSVLNTVNMSFINWILDDKYPYKSL